MALTETTSIPLGFKAPHFKLHDVVSDRELRPEDVLGKEGLVVLFICNHSQYVVHIQEELVRLAMSYTAKGFGFVAISSNDVMQYPEDGPEHMRRLAMDLAFPFPYLYDEQQEAARAYDAVCTPDFAVFDAQLMCVYRGRFDDSTPGNGRAVTGKDLRYSLDQMLLGLPRAVNQMPSMGCSIKWKKEIR